MKEYTIFISSADSYADIWPVFFDLFKRFWPEYNGDIYLNTETKNFSYEGLNITCTQVGKLGSFGKTFQAGLNKIESSFVLLIMIDYFFMEKVNEGLLQQYFNCFKENDFDSLCLINGTFDKSVEVSGTGVKIIIPPSRDMFSFQIAFWKKTVLFQMALPHESPWLSEWYGTLRANLMQIKLAYIVDKMPIIYLAEGALHKGKWVNEMTDFLSGINYDFNFLHRGLFVDHPETFKLRLKNRIKTFGPRCLSNLDLIKRKYLTK